jgi:hypothetical protein
MIFARTSSRFIGCILPTSLWRDPAGHGKEIA